MADEIVTGENTQQPAPVVSQPQVGVSQPTPDAVPQGDNVQLAPEQTSVSQPATDEKGAVPYERFAEINKRMKDAESRAERNEFIMQQILSAQQNSQAQPQQQPNYFEQAILELGLQNEPVLDSSQQAKVYQLATQKQTQVQQQQIARAMQVQSFIAQHNDYAQVVGSADPVTGNFIPSEPLMKYLQKNPQMATVFQSSPMAHVIAYETIKNSPEYKAATETAESKAAREAAAVIAQANKQNKMASISAVAGGGVLDKVTKIKSMSDAEFRAYKESIMARA